MKSEGGMQETPTGVRITSGEFSILLTLSGDAVVDGHITDPIEARQMWYDHGGTEPEWTRAIASLDARR